MEFLQDKPQESRIFRFSILARVLYLVQAAFAVAIGCILLARGPDGSDGKNLLHWGVGVGMFLLAAYFASSGAYSAVIFSHDSITVRGVLETRSIHRSSVKGYADASVGRQSRIRLISNSPEEADLLVLKYFAFDDGWRSWISSLPDLDNEEAARFTLK